MPKKLLVTILTFLGFASQGLSQQPMPGLYGTDGTINSMDIRGNTLYVGGSFYNVGYPSGQLALVDPILGKPNVNFPRGIGAGDQVMAIISDDQGGWFVGGQFSATAINPSPWIRHIKSDLTVDTAWNIQANGMVRALAKFGDTLFVGGEFTTIRNQPRSYAAAILVSSQSLTDWNPNPNSFVTGLCPTGGFVYIGGGFTILGIGGSSVSRVGLGIVDSRTGAVSSWNPRLTIYGLPYTRFSSFLRMNGNIYIAGAFGYSDTSARAGLMAFSESTGKLLPWNPAASFASSTALFFSTIIGAGDKLYLSGNFDSAYGQERKGFAAVDTAGRLLPWSPKALGPVTQMSLSGDTFYAVGAFDTVNGSIRRGVTAVDTEGTLLPWDPKPQAYGQTILAGNGGVLVGGSFQMIDMQPRIGAAAFDLVSGEPTPWDPEIDHGSSVYAVKATPTNIAIGGNFGYLRGNPKAHLAFVDDSLGNLALTTPDPYSIVYCLALSGTTLYAGGADQSTGASFIRTTVAAWNTTTGELLPWAPRVTENVNAISLYGSNVYISGYFDSAGNAARNGLACLDAATGLATAWNPQPSATVLSIAATANAVYLGGKFTSLGSSPVARSHIAAVDPVNGTPLEWDPSANNDVYAILATQQAVVAAGMFTSIGGASRKYLSLLDLSTGASTAWNPGNINAYPPNALVSSGNNLFVGGDFYVAADRAQGNLIGFTGVTLTDVHGSDRGLQLPSDLTLFQNYPNPFNPSTRIRYTVPGGVVARIRLAIYDVLGREVAVLAEGLQSPGRHEVEFNAANLAGGMYLCRLSTGSSSITRKLVLIK